MFTSQKDVLQALVKSGDTNILAKGASVPEGCVKGFVTEEISIYVQVVGLIDIKLELERIAKDNAKLTKLADTLEAKMKKAGYEDKVPEKVKTENNEKLAKYKAEIADGEKQRDILSKFA